MLVSVVIPTRHRNASLARCLERLAPTFQTIAGDHYEVIVTDDGSTTTAEEMVRGQFPWARWVNGPCRGPAANRNHGARSAHGEWVAFTDDDCLPAPQWLAAFVAGLADHTIDVAEGRTICSEGIASIMQEAPVNETGGNLWSCNMMVRRETFLNLGGFDEAFPNAWCEDVEFNGRVNRAALRRVFLPDAVVDHPVRRRPGGLAEGRRWESRALLWFKEGKDQPLWRWMPIHLLKVRVRQLQQQPIGYDFFAAAGSMVVEFAFVLVHLSAWQRRYEHIARP